MPDTVDVLLRDQAARYGQKDAIVDPADRISYVELDELLSIEGVDEGTAEELQARARDHLEAANRAALEKARELGAEENAFTSNDYTAYYQVLARDRLPVALLVRVD